MNEYLMIGEVLKPQGVRGEVKIKPYAADLEAFHDWKTLYLHDGASYQPIKASCSRVHDGFARVGYHSSTGFMVTKPPSEPTARQPTTKAASTR